jgi:PIN domain nuclease of toxin-antitoxin system
VTRLLLDTSTLIFAAVEPARLSALARREIAEPGNDLWISAVSAYEVAQKHRKGKLATFASADYRHAVKTLRLKVLSVTDEHALAAGAIAHPHNDPWDRLIAAQSRLEGIGVLTPDAEIAALGAQVLW